MLPDKFLSGLLSLLSCLKSFPQAVQSVNNVSFHVFTGNLGDTLGYPAVDENQGESFPGEKGFVLAYGFAKATLNAVSNYRPPDRPGGGKPGTGGG